MKHKAETNEIIQKTLDLLVQDPKLTNKQIADILDIEKTKVARAIRYLVEAGNIERSQTIDAKGRLQRMIVVKCETYKE